MNGIYLNRVVARLFAKATLDAKATFVSFLLGGAFAATGLCQSNFPTTNRYELDPPLDGLWVVSEPQNAVRVVFSKLESKDLEVQLDELRRINKFATLIPSDESVRVMEWVQSKLKDSLTNEQKPDRPNTRLFSQALMTAMAKLGDASQSELVWIVGEKKADLALQAEEILVGWKSSLPLKTWRARIAELRGDWQAISLAIQGVEALDDKESVPILTDLLSKPNLPLPIKLIGSRVLGRLKTDGLESLASNFLASQFSSKELIAAQLIAEHRSDAALAIQQDLIKSDQPAAASIAYQSISKFHSQQADLLAHALLDHKEFTVRELAIANLAKNPIEKNLRRLSEAFFDSHVGLRDQARESLFQHASAPELKPIVDTLVDTQISSNNNLAIEQALILAVQLDRKDLCKRFLVLLNHENEFIRIRAAWGLQEIATSEEVILQVLDFTKRLTEQLKDGKGVSISERLQLAYLLHVFGANEYKPAEPLLREYVPELAQKMTPHARASAIWSLGKILQGSKDSALSGQLQERFFDQGPPDAELENVRYACAITLARLGAMDDPTILTSAGGTLPYKMGVAVAWAIENHGKLSKP
ncbi:MAG: hypothetical protein MUC43_07380 [Pirellula sp.]|jgi:hypothetical protein|nr:hypothetical protein [Pirellula sp.]